MDARIRAAEAAELKQPPNVAREIKTLDEVEESRLLKRVEQVTNSVFTGQLEERLKGREELIDKQHDNLTRALVTQEQYLAHTSNQPLLGAFFHACAHAGHETKSLSGQGQYIEERLTKQFGSALAKTMSVADASEGGNLVLEGTVLDLWLEPLRAESVVLGLNPETVPVPGPTFKVTGFETDPQIVMVDEINTAPLTTTPETGESETQMRKALMLLPITVDFRESSSPAVLRRLQDLSRAAFRVGFDLRYLTGTGLANSIKGLREHISESTPSAGQSVENVLEDAETAFNSVQTFNIMMERFAMIFHPRIKNHLMFLYDTVKGGHPIFMDEMRAGTWLGWPFGTTTNIPVNLGGGSNESYILWVAMNNFFVALSTQLDLQWFQNASYSEAGQLVSTIERDTEVLRGRMKSATLMPHRTAGYVTTGVLYGT